MTQTDGEKELVLGNKQLISLFFVVVALCGVFFAMGYLIGRNSTKAALASGGDGISPAEAPSGQRQQPEPPRETAAQPDAGAMPSAEAPAPSGVETKPAQDSAGAPASSGDSGPKTATPAPGKTIVVPVPPTAELEAGASYLQVAALQQRADADNVIRTLREQDLPAIAAQNPKDGLFRVLVGPYRQTAQVADAKARLKTLGFANAFVQKQ
jgi:cell division septation protein DedD